jgi:thiosulfate dehydrogenase
MKHNRLFRHACVSFSLLAMAVVWASVAQAADAIRGGLLWDRYWRVNGATQPTGNHPLYPMGGPQSGSTTYRCKECHGWDYKGVDGAYGSPGGSRYTGIPGVFGTTLTTSEMTDIIKTTSVPNGHGFENYGLTDGDIDDLVAFVQALVIDTDAYIDAQGDFIGDPVQGQTNYDSVGACAVCHGSEGTAINFGAPDEPEWVGTIAVDNPWELLHKIRFGNPGTSMPSWVEDGGSNQGAADIGAYSQQSHPAQSLCTKLPRTSCAQSAKAVLSIKKPADPAKARLKFTWTKGEAVDQADFGDPDTTTNYALCVYDSDRAVVSAAPTIDVRPNAAWLSKDPNGWRYKDKDRAYAGVWKVTLKPGATDTAKASVIGKGAGLPLPAAVGPDRFFAQDPSVTVQLVNESEQCWTASFTGSKKNAAEVFKATLP